MTVRPGLLAGLLLLSVVTIPTFEAHAVDYHSTRQYYSGWNRHPTANYHFRFYYYKPTPQYSGFKHHYVIYHPARPKHLYFYNPYKKQYWGRCEVSTNGRPLYSLLKPDDRRGALNEIPESAFPPPSPVPSIPEAEDAVPLDLPPDDLPGIGAAHVDVPPAE